MISVDTKKKENVGEFKNGGREWRPKGEPAGVRTHDFPDEQLGKAIPYGVYDLAANAGWVSVGTDHDTAAFAVESIRRWWNAAGRAAYPGARRLLITADAGGSNGYRTRAWKAELAAFALQAGLAVTVCHFPPGTSKWNRIEHRLFSHITMNWRGRPLTSHEVIVNTIAATTTRTGLTVRAELDPGTYDTGVKVSDEQMASLPLDRHDWHGDWNYTLRPEPPRPPGSPAPAAARPPRRDSAGWAHPALTGMPPADWAQLTSALVIPYQAHREAGLHIARGGPASRKPAGGYPAALTLPEMILATILRARFRMPLRVTRRAVRRRHRHHRQGRAPDPAAPGPAPARHPAGRNTRQDPRRTHRVRRSTRRHAHPGNQSRALIICKLLVIDVASPWIASCCLAYFLTLTTIKVEDKRVTIGYVPSAVSEARHGPFIARVAGGRGAYEVGLSPVIRTKPECEKGNS